MAEVVGIVEVQEMALALIDLSGFIIKELKAQQPVTAELMKAFADLMANEDLKAKLMKAYDGAANIPAEIKDFSVPEALQLAMVIVPEVVKVVSSL